MKDKLPNIHNNSISIMNQFTSQTMFSIITDEYGVVNDDTIIEAIKSFYKGVLMREATVTKLLKGQGSFLVEIEDFGDITLSWSWTPYIDIRKSNK